MPEKAIPDEAKRQLLAREALARFEDVTIEGTGAAHGGKIATNIMHFARVLRAAGLPVGPGKVIDAIKAVQTVGLASREDFYWTLHAVFVNRRDQFEIFDQAFHVFWRNPQLLDRMMQLVMPTLIDESAPPPEAEEMNRRLAEALQQERQNEEGGGESDEDPEVEIDAVMTFSAQEVLQDMDFEKMSTEELNLAKRAIARMRLPIMEVPTRRFRRDRAGARIAM
ncbi:MAG: hypothetical protein VW644_11510, partial [Alphaproteobacteria bacterium]